MPKLLVNANLGMDYACTEAINTLCTNLMFSGGNVKRIMVTSSRSGEGKSFLSLQVALTLAKLGKNVVLVDADFRRSVFSVNNNIRFKGEGSGITHFLAGLCPLEDAFYTTNIQGLDIMPVRRRVTNALSLLNLPVFGEMIKELGDNYDYVIVDAPPVGIVIDAAQISRYCDGTLFVVQFNTISKREFLESARQIERAGSTLLGVVLNNVKLDSYVSKKYYYKSYYSYYTSEYYKPPTRKKVAQKGNPKQDTENHEQEPPASDEE